MALVIAMKRSILALVALMAAGPAFAADDGYPPGLFEHSPVVGGPNDPADSHGPPDAAGPSGADGSLDDYCAGIASRTFRSLAEVKRAHARCDRAQEGAPPDQ
jgi:hypothetical protein